MSSSSSVDEGVISEFLCKRNTENMNGFQIFFSFAGVLQLVRRLFEPRLKNPGKDLKGIKQK